MWSGQAVRNILNNRLRVKLYCGGRGYVLNYKTLRGKNRYQRFAYRKQTQLETGCVRKRISESKRGYEADYPVFAHRRTNAGDSLMRIQKPTSNRQIQVYLLEIGSLSYFLHLRHYFFINIFWKSFFIEIKFQPYWSALFCHSCEILYTTSSSLSCQTNRAMLSYSFDFA